jgi:hypothetical protein
MLAGLIFVLPAASIGCNAVLGIDPAKLNPEAGTGGAAGASGACAQLGKTDCGTCIAAQCCEEFKSCFDDPDCRKAVEVYDGCIFRPPSDAGGATCSEDLGTRLNPRARDLANCMFVDLSGGPPKPGKCADVCEGAAIGDDPCANYCGCMADFCPAKIPESCHMACEKLSPEQQQCRTYHCFLGSRVTPEIHCRHAVGELGVCP